MHLDLIICTNNSFFIDADLIENDINCINNVPKLYCEDAEKKILYRTYRESIFDGDNGDQMERQRVPMLVTLDLKNKKVYKKELFQKFNINLQKVSDSEPITWRDCM